ENGAIGVEKFKKALEDDDGENPNRKGFDIVLMAITTNSTLAKSPAASSTITNFKFPPSSLFNKTIPSSPVSESNNHLTHLLKRIDFYKEEYQIMIHSKRSTADKFEIEPNNFVTVEKFKKALDDDGEYRKGFDIVLMAITTNTTLAKSPAASHTITNFEFPSSSLFNKTIPSSPVSESNNHLKPFTQKNRFLHRRVSNPDQFSFQNNSFSITSLLKPKISIKIPKSK
ncbi:12440_t:CDS:2, partial [Rhizophagus irregularis]